MLARHECGFFTNLLHDGHSLTRIEDLELSMGKRKKPRRGGRKPSPPAPKPNRVPWIVGGAIALAAVIAFAVVRLTSAPPAPAPAPAGVAAKAESVREERLVGRWLRPDGGYVLEIRRAQPDGRLEAAYLNPRPIHVARAEWQRKEGRLQVLVELRDVNYPGSTYTLDFSSESDRLVGAYFQAVQQQTFDVEFVRQK